jgi:hypothetical protein
MDRPFQVGDQVRVVRIPPFIESEDYPYPEVKRAFAAALGNVYRVDYVDWGGWVSLSLGRRHGGIGIQPDCVELVQQPTDN